MPQNESVIPSTTETLRAQRREQQNKANGVETPISRRSARLIAEQQNRR
ncbi:hypothetical protein [Micromonospora sp. WMMC250]|nr:hypothetical protein [Micromonospora sp. WMMC250]MCZ7376563.1 hypothetical protein [Micromonospora sp. WMMC250]